jgi:hypothetical protein
VFVSVASKTAQKSSLVPGLSTPARRVMGVVAQARPTRRGREITYATVAAVALFSSTPML